MRGVDDEIEALRQQHGCDFARGELFRRDGHMPGRGQQRLRVVCYHAGGHIAGLRGQKFNQLASLGCAAEDTDVIHCDTLSA